MAFSCQNYLHKNIFVFCKVNISNDNVTSLLFIFTAPSVFGIGLSAYLLSKEIFIIHEEVIICEKFY